MTKKKTSKKKTSKKKTSKKKTSLSWGHDDNAAPGRWLGGPTIMEAERPTPKSSKRMCYFVPADAYVDLHGFRPSVVVEGEAGHRPTGTWPYTGAVGETRPYFWGHNLKEAEAIAREMNERLGLSDKDVVRIVASSMIAQHREEQEDELA